MLQQKNYSGGYTLLLLRRNNLWSKDFVFTDYES